MAESAQARRRSASSVSGRTPPICSRQSEDAGIAAVDRLQSSSAKSVGTEPHFKKTKCVGRKPLSFYFYFD